MNWYWAEIRLPEKITFYTEKELKRRGILGDLEYMRNRYRNYQQPVALTQEHVIKLKERGVQVLKPSFLALNGVWHWFTGYSNMDAFRLNPKMVREIELNGFLTINFMEKRKWDRLFIVSCTREKIWKKDPNAPKYVPAKEAYVGEHFRKWLNREDSRIYNWLVFSSRYGLIEPDHPIKNYDIEFGGKGSISEKTLINQVLYHDFGFKVKDFSDVYFVGLEGYYIKLKEIFETIGINLKKFTI